MPLGVILLFYSHCVHVSHPQQSHIYTRARDNQLLANSDAFNTSFLPVHLFQPLFWLGVSLFLSHSPLKPWCCLLLTHRNPHLNSVSRPKWQYISISPANSQTGAHWTHCANQTCGPDAYIYNTAYYVTRTPFTCTQIHIYISKCTTG